MVPCCWNCDFWVTGYPWLDDRRAEKNEPVGEYRRDIGDCRRHAPGRASEYNPYSWPRTTATTHCGDHEVWRGVKVWA